LARSTSASAPHKVKRRYGDVWLRHPQEQRPVRTLYLVRHGHYVYTGERGLSPLGIRQVKRLARRLAKEKFDIIHYSTIQRAMETSLLISGHHPDASVRPSTLLWEVHPPFFKPRRPKKHERERYEQVRAQMKEDEARLEKVYERFLAPVKSDRTELLVCHGNIIRSLVVKVLGVKRQERAPILTRNTGLTEIRIWADGWPLLCRYDDIGHLTPAMTSVS